MGTYAEELKRARTEYYRASESIEWIVAEAMCSAFHEVTGKKVTDRLREKIHEAIRFE